MIECSTKKVFSVLDRPEISDTFSNSRVMTGKRIQEFMFHYNEKVLFAIEPKRFNYVQYNGISWLKHEFTYPSFDHFTFLFKSTVFSVLIELYSESWSSLSDKQKMAFITKCDEFDLVPAIFKIKYNPKLNKYDGYYAIINLSSADDLSNKNLLRGYPMVYNLLGPYKIHSASL